MKRIIINHIILLIILAFPAGASAAEYFMAPPTGGMTQATDPGDGTSANPWHYFVNAFAGMGGENTLTIRDGTYGQILFNPPSGTASQYTVIRAEHDGAVTVTRPFDTDPYRGALNIDASYGGTGQYTQIEGIRFQGGNTDGTGASAAVLLGIDHVKIKRCAFFDPSTRSASETPGDTNYHTFSMDRSSYVLIEDCSAWGYGRYKFESHISDHIIFRRVVGRYDRMRAHYPMAVFGIYSSAYNQLQNCIAIDSDQNSYYTGIDAGSAGFYGGLISPNMWLPDSSNTGFKILGSIALNVGGQGIGAAITHGVHTVSDSVVWDSAAGIAYGIPTGTEESWRAATSLSIDHVTVGDIYGIHSAGDDSEGVGVMSWADGRNTQVANSIFDNNDAFGLCFIQNPDYNIFFNNGADYADLWCTGPGGGLIAHDIHADPALAYILKVESTSPAYGTGNGGTNRGATILKRYGVSGTLWGEPGYETLTDEDLWPWPNQNRIRSDMRTYAGPPSGIRGFAADDMSLTKYIWEYLGNPMPATYAVCGNDALETDEECDDGNTAAGDGCSATCRIETPGAVCGNGVREGTEECDDGNSSNNDACLNTCVAARCGDGYVRTGVELCDIGIAAGNPGACPTSCSDDGNICTDDILRSAGTCSASCTHPNKPDTTVCRTSAGSCDIEERCSAGVCPTDVFQPTATICRVAAGVCDLTEKCTGTFASCPADSKVSAGTTCRASAGICDVAEVCNGSSNTCPADVFVLTTTVCRVAAGVCDAEERCSGTSVLCPANAFQPATTSCRPAAGICDVEERCSGSSADCPSDTKVASGTTCRTSVGACDTAESCSGTSNLCPVDAGITTCTSGDGCCPAGCAYSLDNDCPPPPPPSPPPSEPPPVEPPSPDDQPPSPPDEQSDDATSNDTPAPTEDAGTNNSPATNADTSTSSTNNQPTDSNQSGETGSESIKDLAPGCSLIRR